MKTFLKSALLALAMLVAFGAVLFMTASSAQARPSVARPGVIRPLADPAKAAAVRSAVYPSKSGSIMHVMVEQLTNKPTVVSVVDEDHNTLTVKMTDREPGAYHLRFNVEELPVGSYKLVITGSNKVKTSYAFTISAPKPVEISRQISLL